MSTLRVRTRRHPASKAAVISHDGHVRGCVVADVSLGGARLLIADTVTVPNQFELQTTPSGSPFQCRIIWREDREIGVEFVDWI